MSDQETLNSIVDHLKSVEAKLGGSPINNTQGEHLYALKLLTKVGDMKNNSEKDEIRKEIIDIMCKHSKYGHLFAALYKSG